jgi:tRNA modification GTPase
VKGYKSSTDELAISIKSKIGLDKLLSEISKKAEDIAGNGDVICITRERHRIHIQMAFEALSRFDLTSDLVLAAEDLRIASRSLSLLTGKIEVEEILGEIFENFCIGK